MEKGKQLGIEEGALQKAQAIARNLLQLGALSNEAIAQVIGLMLEQVLALKQE